MSAGYHAPSGWGKPYGIPMWRRSDGLKLYLRRHRIRCRFYDEHGVQYGPEQSNVAPAIAWAMHHGLTDSPPTTCTRSAASLVSRP